MGLTGVKSELLEESPSGYGTYLESTRAGRPPRVRVPPPPQMKTLAKAAAGIWVIVLAYFVWQGVTTPAWEGDSLAYHIPIARNIAVGRWGNFEGTWLQYYSGTGAVILAGLL